MKSRILSALLILASTLWLTNPMYAQTPTPVSSLFEVNIPFSFSTGETTLPAGRYFVSRFPDADRILFRSDDGHAISIVHIMAAPAPRGKSNSGLVFHRYGEIYFLAQVWSARDNRVDGCLKSSAERALEGRQPRNEIALVVNRP